MSKICENCGNMIPDGSDVCPTCGREDDAAIQAVMDDLTEAFGDLNQEDVKQDPASEEENGDTILFDASKVNDALKDAETKNQQERQKHKAGEKSGKSANSNQPGAKKSKNSQNQKKPAGKNVKSGGTNQKKKKQQKKDTSKVLLGVVIGLIVILLVVAGAAVGMLYKMGFFEPMSDEELLGTPTPQTVSEAPTPVAEVSEAPVVPEASSAEDTYVPEASGFEENIPVEDGTDVENVEVTKFKVTGAEYLTLYSRGETSEVVYIIDPSDAKSSIQWESSDETIATVNDYGVIAARRGGTCTVTGTCGDKSIKVYVTCDFTVPDTVLDMNYEDVTMDHEGQTIDLAIDYDLTDEQVKSTVWESSDEAVATVSDKGTVTAVGDGTAVISASIGSYTASCIVRCINVTGNKGVNSSESEYVINYEDVTLTRKGEYFQLTLKSVVGNEVPDFTWVSSDTKVATVDSKGVVTAVANGTCKITTSIGGDDFECIVRVNIGS